MSELEKNLPPTKGPPACPVREGALAAQLGISRDVIRYLRQQHLTEGAHFVRLAKKIHYSLEAVELLQKRLDLPPQELQKLLEASREEKAPPHPPSANTPSARPVAEQRATVTLKVWRAFWRDNPDGSRTYNGVIHAYAPDADPANPDSLVRVTVRSGANYVRDMEIPAHHIAGDVYECARPDPRSRGRW